jgi:phage-related protein
MAYYRLYFLDGFSGRIDHFVQFEVADDDAAIAFAQELHGPLAMELSHGVRRVKHWDPGAALMPRSAA